MAEVRLAFLTQVGIREHQEPVSGALATEELGVIQVPDVPQQAQISACSLKYKIYSPHPFSINPDPPHPSLFQFHSSGISRYVYFPSFSPKPPCLACQSHYSRCKIIPPSLKLKPPLEPPLLQSQLLPLCLPKHWAYFLLHTHIPFLSPLQSNQARQGKGETKHRGNRSPVQFWGTGQAQRRNHRPSPLQIRSHTL